MLVNHARSQTAVRAVLYDQTRFSSSKVSMAICTAVTNVGVLSGCFPHEVIFIFAMVDRITLRFSTICGTAAIFWSRVLPYLMEAHCKYSKENAALI